MHKGRIMFDPNPSTLNSLERVLRSCQITALPQSALKILELAAIPMPGPRNMQRPSRLTRGWRRRCFAL